MDLLPRDAELARRAAGGDGAAFVRLYDQYSEEVFEAASPHGIDRSRGKGYPDRVPADPALAAAPSARPTAKWPRGCWRARARWAERRAAPATTRSRPMPRARLAASAGCAARPSPRRARASTPTGACTCGPATSRDRSPSARRRARERKWPRPLLAAALPPRTLRPRRLGRRRRGQRLGWLLVAGGASGTILADVRATRSKPRSARGRERQPGEPGAAGRGPASRQAAARALWQGAAREGQVRSGLLLAP